MTARIMIVSFMNGLSGPVHWVREVGGEAGPVPLQAMGWDEDEPIHFWEPGKVV